MVDMLSIGDRLRVWRGAGGGLRCAISGGSGVIFPVSGRGGVIFWKLRVTLIGREVFGWG
jgi:hypothetical protein